MKQYSFWTCDTVIIYVSFCFKRFWSTFATFARSLCIWWIKWGCLFAWGLCPTIQCATQRGFQHLDQRWNPLHEQGGPEGEKLQGIWDHWSFTEMNNMSCFLCPFFQIYQKHPLPGRSLYRRDQFWLLVQWISRTKDASRSTIHPERAQLMRRWLKLAPFLDMRSG